jgi:hypothetical protein
MGYTTRRMYLADFGNEWRLNNLWGHVGPANSTPTIQYSMFTNKTTTPAPQRPGKVDHARWPELHKVPFALQSEGLTIQASITASAFAQEFIVLDGDDFGEEDAGERRCGTMPVFRPSRSRSQRPARVCRHRLLPPRFIEGHSPHPER